MKLGHFDFSKKIFYHPDRVAALKAGERPFPVTVEIDLTNACNHRCSFCFYAEHLAQDRSSLDTELVLRTLTDLRTLGTRGVSFTGGGEPLLHRGFGRILAHARAVGLDAGVITNGSAITPRLQPALLRDATWIRVSVAGGDAASYRAVQGVDHFDLVVANLRRLAEARITSGTGLGLGVRMLLTPQNLSSLVDFARILEPMHLDYLQVAPDQFTSDGGAFWDDQATETARAQAEEILSQSGTQLLTSGYVQHQDRLDVPRSCHAHFFQIAILAEGDVAFCKNARGASDFLLGNLHDKSMAEIWAGARNLALESWVRPSNCGLYCKHIQMNLALEDVLHPRTEMSPNFVG